VPPTYITIAENPGGPESHRVIVDLSSVVNVPEELSIYFWCEDAVGARSDFMQLNISFVEAKEHQILIVETYPSSPTAAATDTTLELYDETGFLDEDDNNPHVPPANRPCAMIEYDPAEPLASGTILFIKIYSASFNPGPYSIRVFELGESAVLPDALPLYADSSGADFSDTANEAREVGLDGNPWNDGYDPDDPAQEGPAVIQLGSGNPVYRFLESFDDVDWLMIKIP
jgi:hypothetical protein